MFAFSVLQELYLSLIFQTNIIVTKRKIYPKKKKKVEREIQKSLLRFLFLTLHNIVLRPIKCYE